MKPETRRPPPQYLFNMTAVLRVNCPRITRLFGFRFSNIAPPLLLRWMEFRPLKVRQVKPVCPFILYLQSLRPSPHRVPKGHKLRADSVKLVTKTHVQLPRAIIALNIRPFSTFFALVPHNRRGFMRQRGTKQGRLPSRWIFGAKGRVWNSAFSKVQPREGSAAQVSVF